MVLDTVEESLPSIDQFGIFHIRRGDAIGECDTTLNKISSYLACSLDNLEVYGKTSLLFITMYCGLPIINLCAKLYILLVRRRYLAKACRRAP